MENELNNKINSEELPPQEASEQPQSAREAELPEADAGQSVEDAAQPDSQDDEQTEAPQKPSFTTNIYDFASIMMSALIMIALMFTFVFRVVGVIGSSMKPTVLQGDWLLTTEKHGGYETGDIVVITQPNYFDEPLIKRVIATGGQKVNIDFNTGTVYVDGIALDEPYKNLSGSLHHVEEEMTFPIEVPQGCLFCMGDNRNASTDSRSNRVGFIDERYILGKAKLRILPFGDVNIYDYE
ncbi:MAG: signal peptidase I [Clostridiales bacterium]|nr:signal peptidase I [Clostridiales bacterium]